MDEQSANISTTFWTGLRAPASGDYEFVEHMDKTSCEPSREQRVIHLEIGEEFPRDTKCGERAIWRLIGERSDVEEGEVML